ncbi:hypothetical protein F4827_006996 [Paraburkholderia bannensis]|uniref:Hemolysin n=1 Tax=Paraburkholderia bannensis TaxID=765414 RepID=A0A7W9WV54_9BURK|nr:hypothetical protein [Paraburkholderia sp. WP4_3_2]MBB6107115.1 hypothetical protein [Paraburkholderia bannensis]
MLRAALLITSCTALSACVSNSSAEYALRAYPIHDVKIGGPAPGVCDWNEKTGVHYTAIDNETNKLVSGVLCTNLGETNSMLHDDQ